MDRDKLERMRSKLGLNGMDEEDKKRLFQSFVDVGGKVLEVKDKKEEKPKRSRPVQKVRTTKISEVSQRGAKQPVVPTKSAAISDKKKVVKVSPFARWLGRTGAGLACVFAGILKWNKRQYRRSFSRLLVENTQNALLEIRMILASVMHQNEKITLAIRKELKRGQTLSYDYEFLYRLDSLYEENLFKKLEQAKGDLLEVNRTLEELKLFFRQLFVMQTHVSELKSAVERALLIEMRLRRLPKNASSENIRKINLRIDFLFNTAYPKLMVLMDYFHKLNAYNNSFSEFLKMDDTDELGYYTTKWKEIADTEEQKKRLAEDRKQQEQSPAVSSDGSPLNSEDDLPLKRGLQILQELADPKVLLQQYRSKKDPRALFSLKDKVFLTYAFVEAFEHEYSFIFTSGKVIFNVVFISGGRTDVRKELSEYYFKINAIYERVNEYLKILRDIYKVEQDHYVGMAEKSSRLNQFSIHRSRISRLVRKEALDLFEKFYRTLLFVLSDYEGDRSILQNADEVLNFGTQIEKNRRSNGKKIISVVEEAYWICYTIHSLLGEGDLGGFPVLLEKPVMLKWLQDPSHEE